VAENEYRSIDYIYDPNEDAEIEAQDVNEEEIKNEENSSN